MKQITHEQILYTIKVIYTCSTAQPTLTSIYLQNTQAVSTWSWATRRNGLNKHLDQIIQNHLPGIGSSDQELSFPGPFVISKRSSPLCSMPNYIYLWRGISTRFINEKFLIPDSVGMPWIFLAGLDVFTNIISHSWPCKAPFDPPPGSVVAQVTG